METKKKSTAAWLWEFVEPHKSGYLFSVICAILGIAASIAPYLCVAQMINMLIGGETDLAVYGRYCILMAGFWILRYIFHGLSTSTSHKATFAVISEVRLKMADKLTRLPMGYVLDTPSGTLKNMMVEKVDAIETTLAHVVPEMTANVFVSVSMIILLFVTNWQMALVALITVPIGILFYMGMMIGYEEKYANYVNKNKQLNAATVEYIGGIEVVKAFNQSASSYEKFMVAAREAADSAINWMRSCQFFFAGAMAIFPATLISVLPLGCVFFMRGSVDGETLVFCIILALGIIGPLITTMSYTDDLGRISTIIGDIAEVLSVEDLERPKSGEAPDCFDIELAQVRFGYGETEVLKGVNLSIPQHSVTALVGPSGGGKSTIAKLITSMWDVTDGSIRIGGIDLKQIPLEKLNDMIAYVSQDNYLFDDTVRGNIRMGNLKATDREVEEAAKRSGCHEFIMQLTDGYETRVGSGGGHLSGGECQRIAIARAMLKDAPIVILDEATAYTDPENEAVIQRAVSRLVAGKTLIVIAHRLSTITDSDKIVVVKDGEVSAEGTHEELLTFSELYRSMWEAHKSVKDADGTGCDVQAKEVLV